MGLALDEHRQTTAPVEPQREQPRAEPVRDRRLSPAGVLQLQRAHGNQAVQNMIRTTKPVIARDAVVMQAGYMSGDMFGIGAALTLDPTLRVLILEEGDDQFKGVREEQSALYEAFYTTALKQAGVKAEEIPNRIKRVKVNDTNTAYKYFTGGHLKKPYTGPKWDELGFKGHYPEKAGYATTVVGNSYKSKTEASQAAVRNAFTGDKKGPTDEQLKEFVASKGFQVGKKYALLWIRLSAKEKSGGAHAELDTSIEGVRQLKKMLKLTGRTPVLVGDRPRKDITADTINMIKFWEEEPFKTFRGLDTRIAQLRMFEYMRGAGIDLLSIGMRSGAMEGPALLGIPTMYIEETGNKQAGRMEKWKGKVPGWSQLKVGTLPTRTGKRYQKEGSYVPGRDKAVRDAINEVASAMDVEWGEATNVLYPSFHATQSTFITNVKTTLKVADLKANVSAAMGRWHKAYGDHKIVLDKLVGAEAAVVKETGKDYDTVSSALKEGGADNVNTGLADYLRIVLPKLTPPKPEKKDGEAEKSEAEKKLEAEKLEAITKSVRDWRAIWVGKSELAKGFTGKDLNAVLYSDTLRADTFAHIRATKTVLMDRIDLLAGERAGTVAGRLENLDWAMPNEFVENYILKCAFPLKSKLRLGGRKDESRESVKQRAIAHGQRPAGSDWWNEFDAKLKDLRVLVWPDMR